MNKEKDKRIQEALIDLYLLLKPRKENDELDSSNYLNSNDEKLKKTDPITLIGYIKSSIDTIIEILVDEKLVEYEKQRENEPQEYESVLIKYESDIRNHIKTEHQLKLYVESLQNEIEDLEKENKILLNKLNNFKNKGILDDSKYESEIKNNKTRIINDENEEVNKLKLELKNTLTILKSYEEQNLKLSNGEKKLKTLYIKKEKQYLENEKKLKDEIKSLNKKIIYYEEKLKKVSNLGNVSMNNNSTNIIKPSTSSTTFKDELNSNAHSSGRSANHSNRKNSTSSLSASSSIDKIERYLRNKIRNKNSNLNPNQNIVNNMKKGKSKTNNILFSKKGDEFLTKLLMNETNISSSGQKKKFHNRHKSLENNNKLLRNKHSSIFKDIINSSVNNSKLNTNRSGNNNSQKNSNNSSLRSINNSKNEHIEMINNINIYTNTLKKDNHNVYYKSNIANSINNSSTNKNIVNHIYNNNKNNNNNRNNQESLKSVNSTNHF